MKRILILLACIAGAAAAFGQNDSLAKATLYSAGLSDGGSVHLSRGESQGTAVFGIIGYEVTLGRRPMENSRFKFMVGINRVEVGFNTLSEPDYSHYEAGEKGFLKVDTWRSWHVGLNLINVQVPLNVKRTLFFNAGVGTTFDSYFFANKLVLDNIGGKIVPRPLEGGQYSGQLGVAAVNIPVQLDVVFHRDLVLSCYASADFIETQSHYRRRSTTFLLHGARTVSMSVGAMLTWDGMGFYIRYGVVPIFRPSTGLVTRPLSFGVTIGM